MSHPWMPLYVRDYLADTGHLSAAEHGAYLLLIMHYWQRGSLPDDDRTLARLARMSDREWLRSKPTIFAFFLDGWKHARIEQELLKSAIKSAARADAGSRGGKAKAKNAESKNVANDTNLTKQNPTDALASSHIHNNSDTSVSGATAPPEQADALSEDPKKILFSSGLAWLRQLTGQAEPSARKLLGKMLSDIGGDQHAGLLLGIFRDAKREDKSDQIAWIHKMIHSRSARAGPKQPRRNPDLEAFEMLTRDDHERNQQNQESSSDRDAVAALAIFGDRARSPSGAY